jgi:hypothetical protein
MSASNFLVSNTGELTDRQLGVVLVREASRNGKE